MAPSQRAVERQSIVIEIQNGTPFDGWGELAASRLNYAGYETRLTPADRTDYTYSTLLDFDVGLTKKLSNFGKSLGNILS